MLLRELFLSEYRTASGRYGSSTADFIKALGPGIVSLMSINPTQRQAAVNDLAEKWDNEFEKLLKKDKTVRERYGVEFKNWVKTNYNIDNVSDKIDVKKCVADGKPNKDYIYKVLNVIFNKAQEEKKQNPKFGSDSSKGIEKGALGSGTDGKTYVWLGNQWVTQDTNAIKKKSVTVTPS